jgi:hypothetical protein
MTLSGRDPDQRFPIPRELTGEFQAAPELAELADAIIRHHNIRFKHLSDVKVEYLWKARGGKRNGMLTLGRCQKPSGMLGHYSGAMYIVWLAADNCRDHGMTNWQIEALLFHELSHTDVHEDDDGNETYVLAGHDFEGFRQELEHYGAWKTDLKLMTEQIRQMTLF